jgi:pimeloyl-ACP methyl ester carboxylesterase
MLNLIKIYYSFLSFLLPKQAANSAFLIFQKVRKKDIRNREKNFFKNGSLSKIKFEPENLNCIEYGQQYNDVVLLVHGWDSNAGCMSAISEALLKTKKHILSFNLPGHADYNSAATNLQECQLALQAVLDQIPLNKNISIISHSFGSAVTSYALSKNKRLIDKLIFLTSPDKVIDIFSDFKNLISLGNKSYHVLLNKAESVIGEKIVNIEVSQKLATSHVNSLFLFHDKYDKVIPFKNSVQINKSITFSKLYQYENIGHYRMLWNKQLINDILKIF